MSYRMLIAAAVAVSAPLAPLLAQAMSGPTYVMKAGAGDLYEIQSSQLVLQTTADPAIRQFATGMIADHTKSTADVKAAAAKARIKAGPPMLEPLQAEMIAELRSETGPARDATYIAQQRQAHQSALNLHKAYMMGGTVAPLKATAGMIVPVVQMHVDMLAKM